jgi:hypothetical protein
MSSQGGAGRRHGLTGEAARCEASRQRQRGAGGAAQARRRRRGAGGAAHGGAARGGAERGGAGRGGAVTVQKKVTSPKKGGRRRAPGLFKPHSHSPSESPGQRDRGPWREVRRPPCSRRRLCVRHAGALRAVGPKLGGALKTSHPPPRPRVRAQRQCWPIRRRSWSREHRASCGHSCGTRMRGPSGPRARASASSAALRSTSRASATFKWGGPHRGPLRGDHAGTFHGHVLFSQAETRFSALFCTFRSLIPHPPPLSPLFFSGEASQ